VKPFLFVTDLDNTLVGDDQALAELNRQLSQHRTEHGTKIVYATGITHPLSATPNRKAAFGTRRPDRRRGDKFTSTAVTLDPTWSERLSQDREW